MKHMEVNSQQEGAFLYVSVPRTTREQREKVADAARKQTLNMYKEALDKVRFLALIFNFEMLNFQLYTRFVKQNAAKQKDVDKMKQNESYLLDQKKLYLHNAKVYIEERCSQLFKEVV